MLQIAVIFRNIKITNICTTLITYMMAEIDEFFRKVQILLTKKDKEFGELKFLTSQATPENKNNVKHLCESIADVYRSFTLLNTECKQKVIVLDSKCVQGFKCLLLNTNFKIQEELAEDMLNGFLVDMCPPLSPYLFIQILWHLKYERLLVESVLHVPLDLHVEILEIVIRCIDDLDFARARNIICELIINTYKKLLLIRDHGCQSLSLVDNVKSLTACFQDLTALLISSKFICQPDIAVLERYELYGIVIKDIIHITKTCIEAEINGIALVENAEKLYKLTLGRKLIEKCEDNIMQESLNMVNQELINLLLKKIKEIDCHIYVGWAELNDKENNTLSLQRSVGNECYYFIEFIKNDAPMLYNEHLVHCLQQLSSKPDPNGCGSLLSLNELCHNVNSGKKEYIKQIIARYKEWDCTIIDFIYENKSLLDKNDCVIILKYLTLTLINSSLADFKKNTYAIVTKILLLQNIPDIYEIIVEYIIKHKDSNYLEFEHIEEACHHFISYNSNLNSAKNLKIVLFLLLQSPKKVLKILLKVTLGYPQYSNIIIPAHDLLLLSPIMSIKEDSNKTLLIDTLQSICSENVEWSTRQFSNFIHVMLDNSVFQIEDLINNIFIPYMERSDSNIANVKLILNIIHQVQEQCTENINAKDLLICLAKQMLTLRKCKKVSKYLIEETLVHIIRIIEYFLHDNPDNLDLATKRCITDDIEMFLEPINRPYFAPLWQLTQKGIGIINVVQDCDRRCTMIVTQLKRNSRLSEKLCVFLATFNFLPDDFLRYVILKSTGTEYEKYASELTILHYCAFGWNSEIDAYDNILRITIEACNLSLDYPCICPYNTYTFLMKCLTRFSKTFVKLNGMIKFKEIHQALVKNISSLENSIKDSSYSAFYTNLSTEANKYQDSEFTIHCLERFLELLDQFIMQCEEYDYGENEKKIHSTHTKNSKLREMHDIISMCMSVPMTETYECITKMDRLLFLNVKCNVPVLT